MQVKPAGASNGPQRERLFRGRKATDRAMVLPLLGLFALLPPFASIFELNLSIGGVPFTALYLFLVWALLIIGAALIAPRLRDYDERAQRFAAREGDDSPQS